MISFPFTHPFKKGQKVMGLQDALIEYIIIVCEFAIVKIVQV